MTNSDNWIQAGIVRVTPECVVDAMLRPHVFYRWRETITDRHFERVETTGLPDDCQLSGVCVGNCRVSGCYVGNYGDIHFRFEGPNLPKILAGESIPNITVTYESQAMNLRDFINCILRDSGLADRYEVTLKDKLAES